MFEYSIHQKEYTAWSRRLQKQGLHHIWLDRDTPVTHVTFNPRNPAHVILQDMYMFCIIDQSLVRSAALSALGLTNAGTKEQTGPFSKCL